MKACKIAICVRRIAENVSLKSYMLMFLQADTQEKGL